MRSLSDFRPYQHAALEFAKNTRRSYLAAKAGAGKTGVGLALAAHVLQDTFETAKVLVVAPKRVAEQWPRAAKEWAFGEQLRFSVYVGTAAKRDAALVAPHDVLCVSFDFFPELAARIKAKNWPYGLVIFDEASRLRKGGRRGSVTWKAMNAISGKTDARMLLMSGSPRPGTAHELFAPVAVLDRGQRLGTTLTGFRSEYLMPLKQNRHTGQVYSWQLQPGKEAELYDRIGDLYFAVAPDLGLDSVTVDRWVEMPARVVGMCNELQRKQVLDLDELDITAPSQGNVTGKLHQMGQGAVYDDSGRVVELHSAKLEELAEVIEEIDAPVIVAYWYEHDKSRLQAAYPGAVDLGTSAGLSAALRGEVEIGLLHPASAGHGIDGLQRWFSNLIWFAVPASYELYEQTNARVVRSGMLGDTATIYRILCGQLDARVIERLEEKRIEQERFFQHLEESRA